MNIVCLGCSYTAGMPDDYYSWPEMLAQLRPDDNIYNLAVGGSSLIFSLHMLELFKKDLVADIVIFQITNPHRHTFFKNLKLNFNQNKNYFRLSPNIRKEQNILTVTPADTTDTWSSISQKISFAKTYYKFYSPTLGDLNFNILKEKTKTVSDFSFVYNDIPAEAQLNTLDEAGHLNANGHNIVANWINNELERDIY
jgi:hypothetical protein